MWSYSTCQGPNISRDLGALRGFFWFTDSAFVLYWLTTALHWIPPEYAFKNYTDPVLVAWNWSFLPLDLLISATGFYTLRLLERHPQQARGWATISLTLTVVAGLNAVSFWFLRHDFDLVWWLPNLYLVIYPFIFLPRLLSLKSQLLS